MTDLDAVYPSRIEAVEDVHREGLPETRDSLSWFYTTVCDLKDETVGPTSNQLRFGSTGPVRLLINLTKRPIVHSEGFAVVIAVSSIEGAVERLEEQGFPLTWEHGVDWADRRVCTLDPAGNRVELKRNWPFGIL